MNREPLPSNMPMRKSPPAAREASKRYHLMHKQLVGPASADSLMHLYEGLIESQNVEHKYEAGWAAAEAGLVARNVPLQERLGMLAAAQSAWESSHELSLAHTKLAQHSDHTRTLRIETAKGFLPLFNDIINGEFTVDNCAKAYESLLEVSDKTMKSALYAHENNRGEISCYLGLVHEQNTMKSTNHTLSDTAVAAPSLARSDNGNHYPRQTHDVQILHFRGRHPKTVSSVEVKSKKHPSRYNCGVVVADKHLGGASIHSALKLHEAFILQHENPNHLTNEQLRLIGNATLNVAMIAAQSTSKTPRAN